MTSANILVNLTSKHFKNESQWRKAVKYSLLRIHLESDPRRKSWEVRQHELCLLQKKELFMIKTTRRCPGHLLNISELEKKNINFKN